MSFPDVALDLLHLSAVLLQRIRLLSNHAVTHHCRHALPLGCRAICSAGSESPGMHRSCNQCFRRLKRLRPACLIIGCQHDCCERLRHIVHDNKFLHQHELNRPYPDFVRVRLRKFLGIPHEIIAHISDQPAGKVQFVTVFPNFKLTVIFL